MRKLLGLTLVAVGAFLATVALLLWFWVPGQVKKTPTDIDSVTTLTGEATYLSEDRVPVKYTSHTIADSKASTDDVVVFSSFSCLMRDPNGDAPACESADVKDTALISASDDRFATDRRSAVAVDAAKYVGADAVQHEGLVNKFPFDVQMKSYPFWDGLIGRTVDLVFEGSENIDGLTVYRFHKRVDNEPIQIAEGVDGTYSDDLLIWVDPETGSMIKQQDTQKRTLDNGDNALDLSMVYTDDTIAANVKSAKDSGRQLSLLGVLAPVTMLLGLVSLLGGLLLYARSLTPATPRGERAARREERTEDPAPAGY